MKWWQWTLVVLGVLVVIGITAPADDGPSEGGGDDEPPVLTDARVKGDCPSFLAVGLPRELRIHVTNTGTDDWPVTFLSFFDGLDSFVVNNARLGTLVGRTADTPAIDTYRFGTGAGLSAGESGTIVLNVTPKDAGNVTLDFGVWGGGANERSVPDVELVSCEDLAIQP